MKNETSVTFLTRSETSGFVVPDGVTLEVTSTCEIALFQNSLIEVPDSHHAMHHSYR